MSRLNGRKKKTRGKKKARTGSLGFEAKLWEAADLLRSNMDPSEYKHVVLGLIFLKYISDAFGERRDHLTSLVADPQLEYYASRDDREAAGAAVRQRHGISPRGRRPRG